MLLELAFLFGSVIMAQSSTITHAVTDNQCGRRFTIDEEETFIYNGGYLSFPCDLKLISSDTLDEICVSAITKDTFCNVRLAYYDNFIGSYPEAEVDCYSTNPTKEHCTLSSVLYVVFSEMDKGKSMTGVNIKFKAYRKDNSSDIIEDVQYVGIIVLIAIASVVVIVICCNRRRRSAPGMVYNQVQMQYTTVPQVPYPYPAQPQQQYYPPGPQPMGYGQPMGPQPVTGNPPAPGAYGTGYQGPPANSQPEKTASAPAMTNDFETQPPPYPGN